MDITRPSAAAQASTLAQLGYQIDILMVIRWLVYFVLIYRTFDIYITYGQKQSAKDRVTQRYSIANADIIPTLTREECELMAITIRNTVANVKITDERLKKKVRTHSLKTVKFSGENKYYKPIVWEGQQKISPVKIPVPESGDRMPPVIGESVEENILPETDTTKFAKDLARQIIEIQEQVNDQQQTNHQEDENVIEQTAIVIERVAEQLKAYSETNEDTTQKATTSF